MLANSSTFFLTTHLRACALCMRSCGCSAHRCLTHVVQGPSSQTSWGPFTHIIHITVDSKKLVARISLWDCTDYRAQLQMLPRYTRSTTQDPLAGELCFGASIKGAVFQGGTRVSWVFLLFAFDSSPPLGARLRVLPVSSKDSSDYISVIISLRPSQHPLFVI